MKIGAIAGRLQIAMKLYHFMAGQAGGSPPIQTKDLDFATPQRLPVRGGSPVNRLLPDADGPSLVDVQRVGRVPEKAVFEVLVRRRIEEFVADLQ